jgi:hypothetical protein
MVYLAETKNYQVVTMGEKFFQNGVGVTPQNYLFFWLASAWYALWVGARRHTGSLDSNKRKQING